ncbi:VRR-NUC domain-containing protein [Marinobacter segnicrescens]|uniref:VRR-NUC domain-containing protein n=1 Tax=Marinobacter segnicrescens TaxID=430453 RepID=UPI003A932305
MSPSESPGQRLRAADLDNPLYYLENMETVVNWVRHHHGDLLTAEERGRLDGFGRLSVSARALLTRMVMRTGELFRAGKLCYSELPEPESVALAELLSTGWVKSVAWVTIDELFRLFTLAELRPALADRLTDLGHSPAMPKGRMKALLADHLDEIDLADWLPEQGNDLVRLGHMALFDRIRLMFFGNLRQSWSDFVLVELGYQQYEEVPFTPESRAFQRREDVDCYLTMHHCREWLDEGRAAEDVWLQVPAATENSWLTSRRDRLLLELGRQAERQGNRELALAALTQSGHREARLKQLRLLERMKRFEEAWTIADQWQTGELSDAEVQGLARILKRLARKVGEPMPTMAQAPAPDEFLITVPFTGAPVELAVQQHLWQDHQPVFYVENTLINALFGLLCWDVIFAPVPGAFFHPFHVGPADLTREDFVPRRRELLDTALANLEGDGYRRMIVDTYQRKQGLANPFVNWHVVTGDLLELALDCMPARHLQVLFRRLLNNLKEHRSGFPDLIRFVPDEKDPDRRYEMIEVKGPGDRLQDHQRRWLAFFAQQGIPARVCYVRWQDAAMSADSSSL